MGSQIAQEAKDYFTTAYEYTIRFYPRYLTWVQQQLSKINVLGGPATMGPEDKMVVAMNDDTLYAQAFLDLSSGPQVLTIPAYDYTYSVLQLDMFGTVLNIKGSSVIDEGGIQGNTSGTPTTASSVYTLYYSDKDNTPPPPSPLYGTGILMPYNVTMLIIRVDKYFNNVSNDDGAHRAYRDVIKEASEFRANLKLQAFDDYTSNPDKGRALILPLVPYYTPSPKMMADEAARLLPSSFIATMQAALADTEDAMLNANPNGTSDQDMIATFNSNYATATAAAYTTPGLLAEIFRGVQAAHTALVNHWHMSRGTNNWIHFDNIGNWAITAGNYTYQNYLDRASLNEYIQYGNDSSACYYADIFVDANGLQLNGDSAYTISLDFDHFSETGVSCLFKRFWSITAYTPEAIELVDNPLNKYVVASYTPDLVTGYDPSTGKGTITIYVQEKMPATTIGTANWLPVPKGPFNLLLRIYGPQGDAATTPASTTFLPKINRVK